MGSKFIFLQVDGYNHGQNIVDKLAKLSKIGVSLEWFTGDVSQYSSTTMKLLFSDDLLWTCFQFQVFQGFSWNFLIC